MTELCRTCGEPIPELDRLRHQVAELERLFGLKQEFPVTFGLTVIESKILGILYKRDMITQGGIYTLLYGALPECDQPDPRVIDQFLHKIRRKMKTFKVQIETIYGHGYRVPRESKQHLQKLIDKHR